MIAIDKTIISLETSTTICSVALWHNNKLFEKSDNSKNSHSRLLIPMIQELLTEAEIKINDVDAIACIKGPGNFTGIRIGIGVAKGLAFAKNLPIYAISPLILIAYYIFHNKDIKDITVITDARIGELYTADFVNKNGVPIIQNKEQLTNIDKIVETKKIVTGDGSEVYKDELLNNNINITNSPAPHAKTIIKLIQNIQVEPVTAEKLTANYIRNNVTY